jgi:hypothetical protein
MEFLTGRRQRDDLLPCHRGHAAEVLYFDADDKVRAAFAHHAQGLQ